MCPPPPPPKYIEHELIFDTHKICFASGPIYDIIFFIKFFCIFFKKFTNIPIYYGDISKP